MLLHDFLRRKAAILAKAKADVDNLLTEISDVKTRAIVNDWEPGDPITDEYPQVDEKKEQADQHLGEVIHTNTDEVKAAADAAIAKPADAAQSLSQNQADAGARLNHTPEGQPQQQPASGNAPA